MGPLVVGPGAIVCAVCIDEVMGLLVSLSDAQRMYAATVDRKPCSFCGQSDGPSAIRVPGDDTLLCVACISLSASLLLEAEAHESDVGRFADLRQLLEFRWPLLLGAYPELTQGGARRQ